VGYICPGVGEVTKPGFNWDHNTALLDLGACE